MATGYEATGAEAGHPHTHRDSTRLREEVRRHYADAALRASAPTEASTAGPAEGTAEDRATDGGCCSPAGGGCCDASGQPTLGVSWYRKADRSDLPDAAVLASLGSGNPTAVAGLRDGETVLDLGSGGGIDVLLSARRVGPTGKAYGLDMTEEMLALARRNAAEAGVDNVEFLRGEIEEIPLPADSVDVVISNCVINLSVDKPAVFAEMYRVLRPGGRIGISDIVADDTLSAAARAERGPYTGCIAGALSGAEYRAHLAAAGFRDATVTATGDVADRMYSADITATKPTG